MENSEKLRTFALAIEKSLASFKGEAKKLGYGVMVTLQILVLPFLVRIRVPQHSESVANYDGLRHLFFCFFLSKICFFLPFRPQFITFDRALSYFSFQ